MKDVVQNTCTAGQEKAFLMSLERTQFLVKNFTDGNIKVFLGENKTFSIIGAGSWERVFNNSDGTKTESVNKVRVIADKDGIVEVASVDW